MSEEWKDIVGYEGLYQVSSFGKVYSNYTHKNLSQGTHKDGYKFVTLRKNCKQKCMLVHRLVAEAFIPNPNNFPFINHKDETPSNNNVNNLEWCTCQYNNTYNDAHIKRGKKLGRTVYAYDKDGNLIGKYFSGREAGRKNNTSSGAVTHVCNGDYGVANNILFSYNELSKQEVIENFKVNKKKKTANENIGLWSKENASKAVNQYDLNNNFIQSFPSAREAGRQLGFSPSLIAGVCRGEHKQSHGYKFKYA